MWTLLDGFILRQLIRPFIMGFLGFVIILSVEPINTAVRNVINQDQSPQVVFLWLLARVPQDLGLAFPMATLLASLNLFSTLSKNSELTALFSGGLDFIRILRPVMVFALLCTLLTAAFNEFILPLSAEKREYYRKAQMQKNLKWKDVKYVVQKTADENLLYIEEVLPGENTLINLSLYFLNANGSALEKRVTARIATQNESQRKNGVWLFKESFHTFYTPGGDFLKKDYFPEIIYPMKESSEVLARDTKKVDEMSLKNLYGWIREYEKSGAFNVLPMKTEFFSKTAIPFSCFIFAFLGACLGIGRMRGGGFVGFGISILIIFFYYFVMTTSLSLGKTGTLSPFLAGWLPNLIFGAYTYYLVVETRGGKGQN